MQYGTQLNTLLTVTNPANSPAQSASRSSPDRDVPDFQSVMAQTRPDVAAPAARADKPASQARAPEPRAQKPAAAEAARDSAKQSPATDRTQTAAHSHPAKAVHSTRDARPAREPSTNDATEPDTVASTATDTSSRANAAGEATGDQDQSALEQPTEPGVMLVTDAGSLRPLQSGLTLAGLLGGLTGNMGDADQLGSLTPLASATNASLFGIQGDTEGGPLNATGLGVSGLGVSGLGTAFSLVAAGMTGQGDLGAADNSLAGDAVNLMDTEVSPDADLTLNLDSGTEATDDAGSGLDLEALTNLFMKGKSDSVSGDKSLSADGKLMGDLLRPTAATPTATVGLGDSLARPLDPSNPASRSFIVQTGLNQSLGQPQWSQAVGEKVLWLAAQNLSAADIRLDPPELGAMQVKVAIQHDQVSVSFVSPHPVVRDALDQQSARLREMFAEQGMNLVNVDVSDRHTRQRDPEETQGSARGNLEPEDDDLQVLGVSDVQSLRLVDHYA